MSAPVPITSADTQQTGFDRLDKALCTFSALEAQLRGAMATLRASGVWETNNDVVYANHLIECAFKVAEEMRREIDTGLVEIHHSHKKLRP